MIILLLFILSLVMQSLYAETGDNFNSRKNTPISAVKGYLQLNGWFFSDFDVNRNGWAPNMEGDGAMVSGNGGAPTEMTGIFTPLLDINGSVSLSFNYTFNLPLQNRRWIKIYATDAANKPLFLLDSLELTGSAKSGITSYRKSLVVPAAGSYKVYINYQGIGGNERIAIDQLAISAAPHYGPEGNVAPVAFSDKFNGTPFRTATGNVLSNDYDPNHEKMTAYLLNDSPDGIVELRPDGSFTFSPKEGFTGSSTHFAYKVCDNGSPALCSATMTATIHFPSAKAGLTSFQASYRKNGVDINWNIAPGNNSAHFEIERSLDGNNFEKVGIVKAGDAVEEYVFTDKKGGSIARKGDLYYRLRQVDEANRVFYSKVMVLRSYGTKNVTAVSVTPDPEVNDILVNVQLKDRAFVVMKVTDANGGEIIKKAALGAYGANIYSIEGTHDLQPGMYQLEVIINSNERLVMKLAKS